MKKRPRIRFQVYRDKRGEWRWRALAANGRNIANGSEGYSKRGNAMRACTVFRNLTVGAATWSTETEVLTAKEKR